MKFHYAILWLALVSISIPGFAQQSSQPLEYIESTSPLPGGGVVASVYVPGRGGPVYRGGPPTTTPAPQGSNRFAAAPPTTPRTASLQPIRATPGVPPMTTVPLAAQTPQMIYPVVPTSAQIPKLGVATPWNRALERAPGTSQPQNYVPQATLRVSQNPNQVGQAPAYIVVQNDPPTTHPGRSIFGSPREYSDGQPVRNLLRFVFP